MVYTLQELCLLAITGNECHLTAAAPFFPFDFERVDYLALGVHRLQMHIKSP